MIIAKTKTFDGGNHYALVLSVPNDGAFGSMYGRYDRVFTVNVRGSAGFYSGRYKLHIGSQVEIVPLDYNVCDIGIIADTSVSNIYVHSSISGAIIEIECEQDDIFTPYLRSELNEVESDLTILARANLNGSRIFVDKADDIKIDVYLKSFGNRIDVDGMIVLRANKTSSGAVTKATLDEFARPSATTNMVVSSVVGNMLLQFNPSGSLNITGTATAGTYVVHQHYYK